MLWGGSGLKAHPWPGTPLTVPAPFHVKPWGNSGWLSQICLNLHSFSSLFILEKNKILTWEMHFEAWCWSRLICTIFPWIGAEEEPGQAHPGQDTDHLWPNAAAPAWMDQILPKSLLKGRKMSKKCSSNAWKLPHFSALRLKFPLPAPLEQLSRGFTPSSCLSCCFHGNWGPTAQIRCFNHYFLPFSSHFPVCQRGTIPLYLTFLRQVLSSLESHISLCFGRIKLGILQRLLSLPTRANFNGKWLPWMSKKSHLFLGVLFHHPILRLSFHHHQINPFQSF